MRVSIRNIHTRRVMGPGGCWIEPGETLDAVISDADRATYELSPLVELIEGTPAPVKKKTVRRKRKKKVNP